MIVARRWSFHDHKYTNCLLPDTASAFEVDMTKKVSCCQCGKMVCFGDCYTSKQIQNNYGIGFAVCEKCYDKECEAEKQWDG